MTGFGWRTFGVKKIFSILSGLLVMGKKVFCKQTADLVKKSFEPACFDSWFLIAWVKQTSSENFVKIEAVVFEIIK